jgi:putative transposase
MMEVTDEGPSPAEKQILRPTPNLDVSNQANPKKRKHVTPDPILSTEANISSNHIPLVKLSNIIPASIGKTSILMSFWNAYAKDMAMKLWLPTTTACVTSPSDCWRNTFNTVKSKSWFSAHIQVPNHRSSPTSFPLPASLSSEIKACVQREIEKNGPALPKPKLVKKIKSEEEKPGAGKTRKIRLYPTPQQQRILMQWFGTARWTYNQCVSSCTVENLPATKKILRALHINADAPNIPKWVLGTPYDVRDEAMNDFVKAFSTQKMLVAQGKRKSFMMKYRSKRSDQSIVIHSKHWKGVTMYKTIFGTEQLKAAEQLPLDLKYDSRLVRDKCGRYFICIPLPLEDHLAYTPENDVIALDPGVRPFMTGYDPSGRVIDIGAKDMTRIYRLCDTMDDLQSRFQSPITKARKRYRMKRAWKRLQIRIRNLIDEVHKKTTLILVKSYKTILLPKFETSQMVKKGKRKIRSKTARGMLTWAHYRFQQRLIDKTREFRQCTVVIVDESYTSKTCGGCGHLHNKLGSNKVFTCPHCHICLDRDVNGARNILLKFLTDFQPQSAQ